MTERDFREALEAILQGDASLEDMDLEGLSITSYTGAGVMTNNEGLVVTTQAGEVFQITIVKA